MLLYFFWNDDFEMAEALIKKTSEKDGDRREGREGESVQSESRSILFYGLV